MITPIYLSESGLAILQDLLAEQVIALSQNPENRIDYEKMNALRLVIIQQAIQHTAPLDQWVVKRQVQDTDRDGTVYWWTQVEHSGQWEDNSIQIDDRLPLTETDAWYTMFSLLPGKNYQVCASQINHKYQRWIEYTLGNNTITHYRVIMTRKDWKDNA